MSEREYFFDTETYWMPTRGKATLNTVPRLVCVQWAYDDERPSVEGRADGCASFLSALRDERVILVGANTGFDLLVLARAVFEESEGETDILPEIFEAFEQGRVRDVLLRAKLNDIARGGCWPDNSLASVAKRAGVVEKVTGKKGVDVWRHRYAELDGIPVDEWPDRAYDYASHDIDLTRGAFRAYAAHNNEAFQCLADFWLKLATAHGLMLDEAWAARVDEFYAGEEDKWRRVLEAEGLIVDGKLKRAAQTSLVEAAWAELGEAPWTTDKGAITCDKKALGYLEEQGVKGPEVPVERFPWVDPDVDLIDTDGRLYVFSALTLFNKASKFRTTYMEPILDAACGPICAGYDCLKDTGRSGCIAEGMRVLTLGGPMKGTPIEDVRAGDYVWGYDQEGRATVARVSWAGKTHSAVPCVRVKMLKKGTRKPVEIVCTPCHRFLLSNGEWRRADELASGDSMMSMSRGPALGGYRRVYATGGDVYREHREVYRQVTGDSPEAVHHIDGCKTNNVPENLVGMSNSEHSSLHIQEVSDEELVARADVLQEWWANAPEGTRSEIARKGEEHPHWLGLTYEEIMIAVVEAEGRPALACKRKGWDYTTFQRYCDAVGFDFKEVARMFNARGDLLSREKIEEARALKEAGTRQPDVLKHIGLGFYRFREMQEHFGFVPYNHTVLSVEPIHGESFDVYDLTVPRIENFICEEVCAHNSRAPNVQNFPSRATLIEKARRKRDPMCVVGSDIRGCFVPRAGHVFVKADYSALEMAGLAQVLVNITGGPTNLAYSINEGDDLHLRVVASALSIDYEEACAHYAAGDATVKAWRDLAKVANYSFPTGASAATFISQARAQGVRVSITQAEHIRDAWFRAWPEMDLYRKFISKCESHGGRFYIEQHGPHGQMRGWRLRGTDRFTSAANTLFQGICADGAKWAGWLIARACYLDHQSPLFGSRTVLFIHDEFVCETPVARSEGAANELSRLMVEGMRMFTPDIRIEAEPCILTDRWAK